MAGIDPNGSGLVDAAKEFVEPSELAIIKTWSPCALAEVNLQPSGHSLHVSDSKWTQIMFGKINVKLLSHNVCRQSLESDTWHQNDLIPIKPHP